ncbi:MAG: sensor histidine kinase [Thauera phenolivorans]|uniref:histidine kinase n=1 Tax=Thauera phenolivorans TaxID=1792543 RepID=A0A7X7LYH8_9RHOO|nr:sensor histidine kinase [Thauera phenolivorans]
MSSAAGPEAGRTPARRRAGSLRNRLSLALALVLLAAGGLLAFALQEFPRRLVEDYMLSRLEHDADHLYARVLEAADGPPGALAAAADQAVGAPYRLPLSGHYFIVQRGAERILSRSLWDEELALPPAAEGAQILRMGGPAGQKLLVYTKRFAPPGEGIAITVTDDLGRLDDAIDRFRERMAIGLALALGLLLLLQRRLLVHGLAPLGAAAEACRRLERGERLVLDTEAPAEVRPMLEALDRLSRHQVQRLGRIRHAAGNLSHALKTPLAVLGQATDELAARGEGELAGRMRVELATMRATIERELRRARLAGGDPSGEGFEARTQLTALSDAIRRLHRERTLQIELAVPARRFPLDREDMLELFGNLLDNACKWARQRVILTLADPGATAESLEASVEDDGPGADAAVLERLGTAGLRSDEGRPGHGLGLAIVADIIAQYGGSAHYGRSEALGGLRVDVRLPLPPH